MGAGVDFGTMLPGSDDENGLEGNEAARPNVPFAASVPSHPVPSHPLPQYPAHRYAMTFKGYLQPTPDGRAALRRLVRPAGQAARQSTAGPAGAAARVATVGCTGRVARTVIATCERFRAKTTRRSTANRATPASAEADR